MFLWIAHFPDVCQDDFDFVIFNEATIFACANMDDFLRSEIIFSFVPETSSVVKSDMTFIDGHK